MTYPAWCLDYKKKACRDKQACYYTVKKVIDFPVDPDSDPDSDPDPQQYSTVLTELWARGPLLDPLFGQGQVGARVCAPEQQAISQISTRTAVQI